MLVLALDTTGRPGSVALMREGRVLVERVGDASQTAGQRLPGELAALLNEFGLKISDVDLFAVAAGPGSFTGLRVGIATIQGLALASGRRVVPVSALEALAFRARAHGPALVAAWIDAQRGEVFAALYATSGRERQAPDPATGLIELEPPTVGRPDAVLTAWLDRGRLREGLPIFVGDGAVASRAVITRRLAGGARVLEPPPLLAGAVAEIAVVRAQRGGAVRPHAIIPVYVRRPDAELAREKKDAGR